ncbi:MAG: hypothetical protein IJ868_09125 [Prevotella sp.]|nr:hypothetical protein [Prevotella sp.]
MKRFYQKYVLSLALALVAFATPASAQAEVAWEGEYTLISSDVFQWRDTLVTLPKAEEEWKVEIRKTETGYIVTKFLNFDLTGYKDGGLALTLDEKNDSVAYIATNSHNLYTCIEKDWEVNAEGDTIASADSTYIILRDGNQQIEPLKIRKQSDGQLKIADFTVWSKNLAVVSPLAFYGVNTPTNGGDPEAPVVAYDWAGTYLVTSDGTFVMDPAMECPEQFLMTIEEDMWNPGSYVITEFWGQQGLNMLNFMTFGIPLKLDEEDGDISYISTAQEQNLLAERDETSYYVLADMFGIGDPIQLTHNDDDTFTLGAFNINTFGYAEGFFPETIAFYFSATAKKGDRDELLAELAASIQGASTASEGAKTYFDLNGRRLSTPQKGISIVRQKLQDGSVVTRKVVIK